MKETETQKLEEELHVSRYIIIYKFALGLVELILGLGILFFGKKAVLFYNSFKANELIEDPRDLLVIATEKIIPYIFVHKGYVVTILIVLGIIKIIGSIGLMYKKTWGIDLLLAMTIILLPFQFINLVRKPSFLDFSYFAIGIFIAFWLVNFKPRQYLKKVKRRFS